MIEVLFSLLTEAELCLGLSHIAEDFVLFILVTAVEDQLAFKDQDWKDVAGEFVVHGHEKLDGEEKVVVEEEDA